jgi:hypothetical protein
MNYAADEGDKDYESKSNLNSDMNYASAEGDKDY